MTDKRFLKTFAAAWVLAAALVLVQVQQPPPAPGDEARTHRRIGKARRDALRQGRRPARPWPSSGPRKACRSWPGFCRTRNSCITPASDWSRFPIRRWTMRCVRPWANSRASCVVGVIDSIGNRRDPKAAGQLKELLANPDVQVARAAAAALGRIAVPECIEALRQALTGPASPRPAVGEASPGCVETLRQALSSRSSLRPAVGDACLAACDRLLATGKATRRRPCTDTLSKADVPEVHPRSRPRTAQCSRGPGGDAASFIEYLGSDDKGLFGVALAAAHELPAKQVRRPWWRNSPNANPSPRKPRNRSRPSR